MCSCSTNKGEHASCIHCSERNIVKSYLCSFLLNVCSKFLIYYVIFVKVLICSEILANGDLRSYLQGLNLRYVWI